jgi:hypothetical protein
MPLTVKPAPVNLGPSLKETWYAEKKGMETDPPPSKTNDQLETEHNTHKRKPYTMKLVQHHSKAAMVV